MTFLATSINNSATIVEKAGAAISDVRGKAVKYSSGNVVLCGAGEAAIGVGILTNDEATASGADVDIQVKDIGMVLTGGAVAKGAELASDANGKLVTASGGDYVIAVAMEAAAAANTYIKAQMCKYIKPAS